jgi:prolyl-tRNA synthetase
MEKAPSTPEDQQAEALAEVEKFETPNVRTIEELVKFFNTTEKKFAKTLIYKADGKVVAVMVRGDRVANETKIVNAIGGAVEFEMADAGTVRTATSAEVGFAGPIGLKVDVLLVDEEVSKMYNFIVGANETGFHYTNINYGRDFQGKIGDFRNVIEGDKCPMCGNALTIARGVEVGHIFKLGTKYSDSMGATFLDENGEYKPLVMGCYGIGINRTMAAIIEQHHDENGITWPLAIAPYHAIVVPVVTKDEEQMRIAEKLYNELKAAGVEVLMDDRNERVGVKFKDSDLIGIPMRITVGKKTSEGMVEFKLRTASDNEIISIGEVIERVKKEFANHNLKL